MNQNAPLFTWEPTEEPGFWYAEPDDTIAISASVDGWEAWDTVSMNRIATGGERLGLLTLVEEDALQWYVRNMKR